MLGGYLQIHTALVNYLALRCEMRLYDGPLIRRSIPPENNEHDAEGRRFHNRRVHWERTPY